MHPLRVVEPAHGGQAIPAALAAEQVSGGCAHACELETSLYLFLDGDNVRKERIKSDVISFNEEDSPFQLGGPFRRWARDTDLLDQQLQ